MRVACRYMDYLHPAWSVDKYQYTTQFWHIVAARFIFVVCFEVDLSDVINGFVFKAKAKDIQSSKAKNKTKDED